MKILSSFDTQWALRRYDHAREIFGDENVLLIRKSKLFFYKYIGWRYFLFFVLMIVGSYLYYTRFSSIAPARVEIVLWAVFGVYLLWVVLSTSAQRMNYRMDYLIVTPHEIQFHDQKSLFSDEIQAMKTDKIKSITSSKTWIIQSLFNVWTLHFLVEGEWENGDIHVDYVDAVEATETKIMNIITPT